MVPFSTRHNLSIKAVAKGLSKERGFILIVVVGMLAVLVVLGLSYVEQGRVELRGVANTRDIAALDALSEVGFQFALRALHDDQNVNHSGYTPTHLSTLGGAGWTSRWGFNPDPTLAGKMPAGLDRAPSRADAYNFQDTWRMLFWNEETVEPVAAWTGKAWGYGFKFRPGNDTQAKRSEETQRFPQPPSVLLDTVQLQPFARVRKFRVQVGSSFGMIQVGITPKDGGLNLNDVFDPGTVNEHPGIYETLAVGSHEGTMGLPPYDVTSSAALMARVPSAAPDRRTMEYLLGKPPQLAQKYKEPARGYRGDPWSFRQALVGSAELDNGTYNWRHYFEPYGSLRAYSHSGGAGTLWKYDYPGGGQRYRASTGFLTSNTSGAPTTVWNVAGGDEPNRFGMEPTRHVMWAAMKGMAFTADGFYGYPGIGYLVDPAHYGSSDATSYLWYPTGLWKNDPRLPATDAQTGNAYYHDADQMFQGFGFDYFNPPRAGIDATYGNIFWHAFYTGAGSYGHPKTRTFQLHFMKAVAQGRFWTDLLAAWYFGGAPGYTNFLGATQASGYNNWAHLGSSYDSLGIGTHWMPPTSHVWLPGFFSKGRISTPSDYTSRGGGSITSASGKDELSRGMTRWPGNMPPARMAATYIVPMARWPADFVGQSNAHFSFNNFRLSVRAHGIQENWGDPFNPGTVSSIAMNNRWYDAVDINNTNFPVAYGLLTPEKMPSMMNRTTVAPNLHWKSRFLDVECRLKRPVKPNGSDQGQPLDYDDILNSWIPVQVGLMKPDSAKSYVAVDWDGNPGDPNLADGKYNPWIPLRMKLQDENKPWNPDDASPNYNVWVEPKLLRPGIAYDPITNPLYNTQAFLDDLKANTNKRNDYIKYPWMPSLRNPIVKFNGADQINLGMYGWDNTVLRTYVDSGGTDWVNEIETNAVYDGLKNFPYMPIDTYGAIPTWHGPGPFDGTGVPYPSPGWNGYLFEPRWYNGWTINPEYLMGMRDGPDGKQPWDFTESAPKDSILKEVSWYFAFPGGKGTADPDAPATASFQSSNEPDNYWDFSKHNEYDEEAVPKNLAKMRRFQGGLGALTYHRHIYVDYDAVKGSTDPDTVNDRRLIVWGKMDFFTPEPYRYYDLNGDLVGHGTGRPQDDVFVDSHTDVTMVQQMSWNTNPHESVMARPDSFRNHADWVAQRKRTIPGDNTGIDRTQAPFRPMTNNVNGQLKIRYKDPDWGWSVKDYHEGKVFNNVNSGTPTWDPDWVGPPASAYRRVVRGTKYNVVDWYDWSGMPEEDVKPHSEYGLANPDYLQNYPGVPVSQHWADQFRRYVPVQYEEIDSAGDPYDDSDNNPSTMANNPYPGAMPQRFKLADDPGLADPAASHTAINPALPVPRTRTGDDQTPVVPAVSKDEAWRITRVGPRYQEIIANELMDYQLNPWWPNPCVPVSELCVPLDKQAYPSEPRARVKVEALTGRNRWRSYVEHMDAESKIGSRVPKYYAYFNRFWCRTNHKAVRNWGGDPNDASRPLGEPYRAISIAGNAAAGIPDELINADEGKGMFPPTWQYFGQYPPGEATFQDRIKDFPYNVMEDQLGDDWRYMAKSVVLMTEPQMQKATGRNHPFRNWADFVAFLGHLVYRTPMNPQATSELALDNPKACRHTIDGVEAWTVCHGPDADVRNKIKFFDGSMVQSGSGGTVYSDSLRSPIVAKAGYWPLAANYGRAPDAGLDPMYPNLPPGGGWSVSEWKRRWDELRGRDEAGMRVEQHYISEKAANDVLVNFSNGRIGPIDFNGDGHVEMNRGDGSVIIPGIPKGNPPEMANAKPSGDIPQQRMNDAWEGLGSHFRAWSLPPGYPWHKRPSPDSAPDDPIVTCENPEFANPNFWDTDNNPKTMSPLNLELGIKKIMPYDPLGPPRGAWQPVPKKLIIRNCVTLPIKFHSNTFRITVVVELTDAEYKDVYATRRYQKVVSRVPDTSVTTVHGPFNGEFIEHSSRAINGVDPELSWLGVK